METSLDFQQTLIRSIHTAANFDEVLDRIVVALAQFAQWDYGEAWIPSSENHCLELHPASYISNALDPTATIAVQQFQTCTKGFVFGAGIGLPGRVWASGQPEWLNDASAQTESVFLRHYIAKALGIRTGFGVPVRSGDRVLAVLVFFALVERATDAGLMQTLTTMGAEIGTSIDALH